jgi:hypothetical protein
MADMKLRHVAALALIAWLIMPLPLRAAGGPIAVPGTADVETWYLMELHVTKVIHQNPQHSFPKDDWMVIAVGHGPLPPLSHWVITKAFPTR